MDFDLDKLNDMQRQVCQHTKGALLVIAGAGSGKTRTLTCRIAHLMQDHDIKPYNILAITFTNKATEEMRVRLRDLPDSKDLWIYTFHGLCLRILKYGITAIGYKSGFSIYGDTEKKALIKRIIKSLNLDDDLLKNAMYYIGDAKSKSISPQDFAINYPNIKNGEDQIQEIYAKYQDALVQSNALDFDDMLLKAHELLTKDSATREYFANKFVYINVDEFQDTNEIQYLIVKLLASKHGNIFAVGDEDQSIYGWRGANINNIKLYMREFGAQLYKLEQNYRSTRNILDIANKCIANNTTRIPKVLWTLEQEGAKVEYYAASGDDAEADYVVGLINRLVHNHNVDPNDIAILMRVNAFSRNFEKRLLAYNIPHKVQGGFKFFDRKEIKDILAYFRLAINPQDNDAFVRALYFPKRGIGETSIAKLQNMSLLTRQSIYDIASDSSYYQNLPRTLVPRLTAFVEVVQGLIGQVQLSDTLNDFVDYLYQVLDIANIYGDDSDESHSRLLNLEEFRSDIAEKVNTNPQLSINDFLDTVTLYAEDVDTVDINRAVTISTIHSAKGLEYDVVFVVGCEEGTLPIKRSLDNPIEIEEERRLMYVAVTRAKKRLYVTSCRSRYIYNSANDYLPSRFLKECGLIKKPEVVADVVKNAPPIKTQFRHKVSTIAKIVTPMDKDLSQFVIGANVLHPKFGKGTIVSVIGEGASMHAMVNFELVGELKLALAYAPLTVSVD
ncbi:MAG: UvrD-helicase domain-containing protein [Clostridiales bacterium]|jgi:DNA helicase-2/ATP-dependent DNA helicase PcrA|nr:UvrD-helicase domain-containing protein [Clostridiales bacterium]